VSSRSREASCELLYSVYLYLTLLKVNGNVTIRYSACDFLFDFNRNYVSIFLPFSRYSRLFVESRRFSPTAPAFGALEGAECRWGGSKSVEFRRDRWHQKTTVPGLSCGVLYVILRLAVLVELRLVTDRHRPMASTTDA